MFLQPSNLILILAVASSAAGAATPAAANASQARPTPKQTPAMTVTPPVYHLAKVTSDFPPTNRVTAEDDDLLGPNNAHVASALPEDSRPPRAVASVRNSKYGMKRGNIGYVPYNVARARLLRGRRRGLKRKARNAARSAQAPRYPGADYCRSYPMRSCYFSG